MSLVILQDMPAAAIIQELLDEKLRRLQPSLIFDRFCRLMREGGVMIERANCSLRQLHPQLIARSFHWDFESGGAVAVDRPYSVMSQADFVASPLAVLLRDGTTIRRRMADPDCPQDFEIIQNLKNQGFTDYRLAPLLLTGGEINALSIATRATQGFTDADLALFDSCVPAMAAAMEIQLLRDTARTLLSTYVGHRTGARVWDGTIRRGQGETLHAIVLLCDLRGFTHLAAAQPLEDTIALLNDYFDAVGGPLGLAGGEILKFMGDALLAIFPCPRDRDGSRLAAAAALDAARAGLAALAAGNERRAMTGHPLLHAGVALSVGEVHYGNIGVADRLDFTVIGPAVNLAARLQGLTVPLGEPILLTGDVAERLDRPARSCGHHALKGVQGNVEVFAP